MKNIRYILIFTIYITVSSLSTLSAKLNEEIDVEGNYVPEVILRDKINVYPEIYTFNPFKPDLNYDDNSTVIEFESSIYTMGATGWRADKKFSGFPGYVDFGAGSWLNMNLSAGYRFINTDDFKVGVRLQHNSTSLWKPVINGKKRDWHQYRYDEALGIYGVKSFKDKGDLSFSVDYKPDFFNYYGVGEGISQYPDFILGAAGLNYTPRQTRNTFDIGIGWNSYKDIFSNNWKVGVQLKYTAYRRLYLPEEYDAASTKGLHETQLRIPALYELPWGNNTIRIAADLNMFFYGGTPKSKDAVTPGFNSYFGNINRPDNYGILNLNPSYLFKYKGFGIKLGVDLDLSVNAGEEGHRYSFFHIAPDVSVSWVKGKFGVEAAVTGASLLNTLSSMQQQDYYSMPLLTSTRPSYVPFDGIFKLNFGPFSGFNFAMQMEYKVVRNVRLGGWYQAWLNYGSLLMPGLNGSQGGLYEVMYSLDRDGINLHGGNIGVNLSYTLPTILSVDAKGSWQPQKNKLGFFNGYDRPRWILEFKAEFKPIEKLTVGIKYDYRGVRNIYTREYVDPFVSGGIIDGEIRENLLSYRLPDLSLLGVNAAWTFTDRIKFWLRLDNLLNRHDEALPLQPLQGINVMAGVDWIF